MSSENNEHPKIQPISSEREEKQSGKKVILADKGPRLLGEISYDFSYLTDCFHSTYSGVGYGGNGKARILSAEIWRESQGFEEFTKRFVDVFNHETLEALGVPHDWIVDMDLPCRRTPRKGVLPPRKLTETEVI